MKSVYVYSNKLIRMKLLSVCVYSVGVDTSLCFVRGWFSGTEALVKENDGREHKINFTKHTLPNQLLI